MGDGTQLEWTDATVNVVNGCTVCSPGCTNCYAMRAGGRNLPGHPSTGLTKPSKAGHVWTGEVRFNERALLQPLRWKRPRRIFWNAHGDLFHENVPDDWIDRCFAVMALTPQHQHQVLTKRSARMRAYFAERWQGTPARQIDCGSAGIIDIPAGGETGRRYQIEIACEELILDLDLADTENDALWTDDGSLILSQWQWPLPNVWLGVSVEDQQRADERIPDLLATPAATRFLSCEPLLGPIDLTRVFLGEGGFDPASDAGPEWKAIKSVRFNVNALVGAPSIAWGKLDWVIVGGESGPGARPMHPDWARSLRDQCAAASVPFLFKQWGDWRETNGPKTTSHHRAVGAGTHWLNSAGVLRPISELGSIYHEYKVAMLGKKAAGRLLDGVQHDGMPS